MSSPIQSRERCPGRLYPASLLPRHAHDIKLLRLLGMRIQTFMIDYIADSILTVFPLESEILSSPSVSIHPHEVVPEQLPAPDIRDEYEEMYFSIHDFIRLLVEKSKVQAPTLLSTLVLLRRLHEKDQTELQEIVNNDHVSYFRHRLFLGLLVIVAKNLNDSSPKNRHWSTYSRFPLAQINCIEVNLLGALDHRLEFEEKELIHVVEPLIEEVDVRTSKPLPLLPQSLLMASISGLPTPPSSPMYTETSSPDVVRVSISAYASPEKKHDKGLAGILTPQDSPNGPNRCVDEIVEVIPINHVRTKKSSMSLPKSCKRNYQCLTIMTPSPMATRIQRSGSISKLFQKGKENQPPLAPSCLRTHKSNPSLSTIAFMAASSKSSLSSSCREALVWIKEKIPG